jgi:hypothetical protein
MGTASYGGGGGVNIDAGIDAAIENPDHAAIGKACGFHAERAGETGRFAAAFERVRVAGNRAGEVGFGECPRVDRGLWH